MAQHILIDVKFLLLVVGIGNLHANIVSASRCMEGGGCSTLTPEPANCTNPSLYSVPDECNCLNWHCDELPLSERRATCPQDWNSYTNTAGETFCVHVFSELHSWDRAQTLCNAEYNADLFNVRRFEKFTEDDSSLQAEMLRDLDGMTEGLPHWSGLHIRQNKLFWDSSLPTPDRDLTATSGSMVTFNPAQWRAFQAGRRCATANFQSSISLLQPEYCSGGHPYVCYKEIIANVDAYYKSNDESLCGGEAGWKGSINGRACYKYFSSLLPFTDAQQICSSHRANLADPRTTINQRFLTGILSNLGNGSSPLLLHVGMRATNTSVSFNVGGTVDEVKLAAESINSLPNAADMCGVLRNPYYANTENSSGIVQFGNCSAARPFICSRNFSSRTVSELAQWSMEVVRDGYSLTCNMSGLEGLPGQVIWKKDHQYFPKQSYFSTISLTTAEYKYMIDDDSNRTIGHGELAGIYYCEFWQLYPSEQYSSPGIPVTFNDTTSLRLSTELNEISWTSELGSFNYRVSQRDELSPAVQQVYDALMEKIQRVLSAETRLNGTVKYGVNILSLSSTPTNKVNVDYRITLTGDKIQRVQLQLNEMSPSSENFIQTIVSTLSGSELVNNNSTTSEPIEAEFTCLQQTREHPQTKENFSLPLRSNRRIVNLRGNCRGEEKVMVTANCQYNMDVRKSSWTDIVFTDCPTDCLVTSVIHSVSGELFSLPNAGQGQNESFSGMCGRHRQEMVSAICEVDGWRVEELGCVLMCLSNQINHPQVSELLPSQEWPVNTVYMFDMMCNSANKTIVTARCALNNAGSDGVWTEVSTELCEVGCGRQTVTHPISIEWNLGSSTLGHSVPLPGLCGNRTINLGLATCNGTLEEGAEWDVSFSTCDVRCSSQTFIHPDTVGEIMLGEGHLNETRTNNLICNNNTLSIVAQCQGTSAVGASWRLIDMPRCSPSCPKGDWYDPITKQTYEFKSAKFKSHSTVEARCGGSDHVLLLAVCTGDIVNGVFWGFQTFNCSPSCLPLDIIHSKTNASLSFPTHQYNGSITLHGKCNGAEDVPLVTGTCGGDITLHPEWINQTHSNCTGYCTPLNIEFDSSREHYRLDAHEVGSVVEVNGTCALQPFVEATAECIGDNENGGEWKYTLHRCGVDTTCTARDFVHPDTKVKLMVGQTDPGVTVHVTGKCHDKEVTLLNVTCQAMTGARGSWVDEIYGNCQTDITDQLSNLLANFKSDPLKLASYTAELSENLGNASGEIVSLMVDIMEFVASPETPKTVETEGKFFFDIVSNMMDVNLGGGTKRSDDKDKPENTTESSASRLAKSVEGFLNSANLTSSRISMKRPNLFVEVIDTSALGETETPEIVSNNGLAVSLPQSVTNGSKLSFVKYDSPAMFKASNPILGNTVFSASIAEKDVKDSEGAITFTMRISPNDVVPDNVICSYWNFTLSGWSSDGCKMVKSDNNSMTCSCNHLTNFAILLDIEGQKNYIPEEHHIALSVITTAGLGISIIALTLHLLSFVFIFKLRQNQFQKVLANLALSILISNVIFLVGIGRTENNAGCIAVAALLHYFILASFAWMFVEAFMQYRRFVKVLGTHVTHILIKAGLPAWLIPAVPVAIVLIINPELYRGGDRFCWMKPEPLYYSFLLPIGCVIVANIVLFTLILRGLTCARPSQLRTNRRERDMRMMYFKAGLAIFTLLGLTWIFGFFAISDARLVFQYLFCITNAFQGLVIFLLHNMRDPKVVTWWRKVLHLKPLKPAMSTTGSSYASKKSGYSVSTTVVECDNDVHLSDENVKNKKLGQNDCSQTTSPSSNRFLQLEHSKLIHSSTESDESCAIHSDGTRNSDV